MVKINFAAVGQSFHGRQIFGPLDAELTGGETGYLKAVTQAFHLSFYVFLIASLCLAPKLNAEQYSSLLGNPNAVGTYTDSVLIAELYLLHGESKTKGRSFFLHLACFGLAGAILGKALYTGKIGYMFAKHDGEA